MPMELFIPFDQDASDAKYQIAIRPNDWEAGDSVILAVNREACKSFSDIFNQLASCKVDNFHLHIGCTEEEPQGPGWRIIVNENGRIID
jgi:hypothetical protein